ncbi:HlyD family efflux transporter periplasmic adaptor subunit [Pseudooctadecabacter jejudonensis]|uniref:Type I secretion system membrane fusion protein PrsE n=1 Tax=Pseudooctadecabacter jejudonensis TaxID=1391910 RepID=A0A1Y5TBJ6_9RHOB|nr:HlyD family efflux transporter periplasmic adaptor subunit [Pseudooctadecabacter jejudonensis]SLN56669.1 Type I secretion system membrane fusion protein PrsE [Pseudooctadecabacter jejudonensis]
MRASGSRKRRSSATLVWVLAAFVTVFVIWARNAPLDEIVRGPGVLVPSSSNQIVQSLEGGILEEINVGEGDFVEEGQIIARLNETQYRADVRDFEGQILAIDARLDRLRAELSGVTDFSLDDRFWQADPILAQSEVQLFEARLFDHETAITSARDKVDLDARQVSLLDDLVAKNAVPEIDLINAQSAALDSQALLDQLTAEFQLDRADEISELLTEKARLEAQIAQSRDQLLRSTLRSPANGIVNTIFTTTVGGVVQPGEPIFEITPQNDELLIEVRIRPADIAFVTPNMPSTIKLTAYDFTIYGSLYGEVAQISADTFEDEETADAEPYYKVLVAIDPASLIGRQEIFDIRPGMLASAELHVGEKTVMQYLIKPLIKANEALREP